MADDFFSAPNSSTASTKAGVTRGSARWVSASERQLQATRASQRSQLNEPSPFSAARTVAASWEVTFQTRQVFQRVGFAEWIPTARRLKGEGDRRFSRRSELRPVYAPLP
jgi:hypothetical protein